MKSNAAAIAQPRAVAICASEAPRDQAFTQRLARDIRALGYQPLFHRRAGEAVLPAADIERADAALIALSPQLLGSARARMEYQEAIRRGKLIIPLQTGAVMQIPQELENIQWVDFYELYERGLVNLEQTLTGHRRPATLRRLQRATIASAIIPFARIALAALMMGAWLLLMNNLFSNGWWILALIPALFLAVGDEQYRRGDPAGWRITITRILTGAAGGALLAVYSLLILPASALAPLIVTLALAGGLLAGLFTWLERRSLNRGRLGASRWLGRLRFLANAAITFAALFGLGVALGEPPTAHERISDVTFATTINFSSAASATFYLATSAAASVALAAAVEWLRSPARHIKNARRQLVETGKGASQINARPAETPLVFISHSSGDNDFVVRLSRDLQQRGIGAWMDRRQLRPGMSWPSEIRQALEGSQIVLVALSSLALASEWVRHEYQSALTQRKNVMVLRLDEGCAVPAELGHARVMDFSTLYVSGLAELLVALRAGQEAVAQARQSLRQRLRYAWLISTVRLLVSTYLILARALVFGTVSFTLLGGFDRVDGAHGLATYPLIWLGRAAPGIALGLFVGLTERARIEGAKPSRWISFGRVINGLLTGEGLLGVWSVGAFGLLLSPATWLILSFLSNQTPWDALAAESALNSASGSSSLPIGTLIVSGLVLAVGVVNAALAIPLARAERRNHEEGKPALLILSRIVQLAARVGIGALGLMIPLYLLFFSPIDPFGPPPPLLGGPYWAWWIYGVALGSATAAIELFFFPAGPSRRALRKLRAAVYARRT